MDSMKPFSKEGAATILGALAFTGAALAAQPNDSPDKVVDPIAHTQTQAPEAMQSLPAEDPLAVPEQSVERCRVISGDTARCVEKCLLDAPHLSE